MNRISNKSIFQIYIILLFITSIGGFCTFFLTLYGLLFNDWAILIGIINNLGIIIVSFLTIFLFVDLYIRPEYLEVSFSLTKINIKTYRINRRNGVFFLTIFYYKKNIQTIEILNNTYSHFIVNNSRFGIKRIIHLFNNDNQKVKKLTLNISLIPIGKYTKLIHNLERFGLKYSLN